MRYSIQFGGGLGDVINQIYTKFKYVFLNHINPDDRVAIVLVCNNFYADELFKYHPKSSQFDIYKLEYTNDANIVAEKLIQLGLPIHDVFIYMGGDIIFYDTEEDRKLINSVEEDFVVFAPYAGTMDRNLPEEIVNEILKIDIPLALVGRNYERNGKGKELPLNVKYNFIDRLTVPGTLNLLKKSKGLITTHSSLNIAAWHIRKPQLVIFPEHVKERHFINVDEWSFGKDYPETVLSTFSEFNSSILKFFLNKI